MLLMQSGPAVSLTQEATQGNAIPTAEPPSQDHTSITSLSFYGGVVPGSLLCLLRWEATWFGKRCPQCCGRSHVLLPCHVPGVGRAHRLSEGSRQACGVETAISMSPEEMSDLSHSCRSIVRAGLQPRWSEPLTGTTLEGYVQNKKGGALTPASPFPSCVCPAPPGYPWLSKCMYFNTEPPFRHLSPCPTPVSSNRIF